ncbi:UNVERIFIED_ORG: phospholipase C [Idiomarina abyssalis]|jgi:phospholipase C|uniref:phospholipase C n=1 Tax=Idiomarina loihiensis (strain ATCC BAA-735 / DSM 15497 / L2-TR) TaxID=283942 RepID=Q5QZF4_IDILO|nr:MULTISPECIES: phospholipase C, phosphocholine-specific [Idiomarina]MBL4855938.1 phospholipase C, phosphocholine-specific [Idiomarina sp.]NWO02193.1 phospholipase C, phosphocholine-specific [Idiomarinaceae bacterium]AAV83427.1 Phospholipase C [Idiomarina loihiensis L2TR]AGM37470.1 phospholipase C [Idiomarina loihiensis GSL 199]TDO45197.1 phospholipase C [Idiomarina sp. 017G]
MVDISRRRFLLGAGAASVMASFPAISRALAIPAAVRTGTIKDIEHVVILMQENRSFDHYFGTLSGARGFSDPYPAPAKSFDQIKDRTIFTQLNQTEIGPKFVTPFALNTRQTFEHMRVEGTPHSWPDAQAAWDNGHMDRWPEAKNLHSMGYFERADMPFQYALADAFTLCDAYHCSMHAGTNSNRLFLWSGTNDGQAQFGGPSIGNSHDRLPEDGGAAIPYTWTTYVERLQEAGVNWRIYQDMSDNFTDNPLVGFAAFQNSVAGKPGSNPELAKRGLTTQALDQLREDIMENKLPSVSYIIATAEGSEHPGPSSPAQGAAYTSEVLDALTANPEVWAKTALFIMFDENDGFFDHVPPPAPPSEDPASPGGYAGHSQVSTRGEYHTHRSEADESLEVQDYMGRPYGLGPRVPAYVISPWSRGGYINSEVLDHTSVIRFLEQRFGVLEPNISPWRRAVCGDFTNAFDFVNPNRDLPLAFPDPTADAKRAAALPKRTTPKLPIQQSMPAQEPGMRPHRPSLYKLDLEWDELPETNTLKLTFINKGKHAAVFHVYNRLNLDSIPHRYTIEAKNKTSREWTLIEDAYDLQVMGPEGFHRRLAGKHSEIQPGRDISFISDGKYCGLLARSDGFTYYLGQDVDTKKRLPQGQVVHIPTDSNQRYDVSVTSTSSDSFLRQFAGRLNR